MRERAQGCVPKDVPFCAEMEGSGQDRQACSSLWLQRMEMVQATGDGTLLLGYQVACASEIYCLSRIQAANGDAEFPCGASQLRFWKAWEAPVRTGSGTERCQAVQSLHTLNDQISHFIVTKSKALEEDKDPFLPTEKETLKSSMTLMRHLLMDAQAGSWTRKTFTGRALCTSRLSVFDPSPRTRSSDVDRCFLKSTCARHMVSDDYTYSYLVLSSCSGPKVMSLSANLLTAQGMSCLHVAQARAPEGCLGFKEMDA
ncbi:hypothetical protein J0S82_016328 [Galemys pyrenaicus]|uniref:Uncharacterized protein n=1 Tax=Galemys pyrenaicus TaxID=202257 RepID=A0A8J6DEH0_GALPY|nr:hypothetical protein J0S82_016328 [Galemys pyrenaicus]